MGKFQSIISAAALAGCFAAASGAAPASAQDKPPVIDDAAAQSAAASEDTGRADNALANILVKMHECTAERGQAQGFKAEDFTVYRGDAPGEDTGGLQKIYCMGNFASGLTQPQQHQIGIICAACLEKYDFCLYKNGHKLGGRERLRCLANYDEKEESAY